MEWIETRGGPLIMLPAAQSRVWHGARAERVGGPNHYELACQVMEYLEVIRVAGVDIVVLGDEPIATTWVSQEWGGLVVRWVYADTEESIQRFLVQADWVALPDNIEMESEQVLYVPGPCLLFDAADPGGEIGGRRLLLDLAPGQYSLSTFFVDPTDELRLLIHRVRRVSPEP